MTKPVEITKKWVATFVVEMNLCPFAKHPFQRDKIRYIVEKNIDSQLIMSSLLKEMQYLSNTSSSKVATTLVILPNTFADFLDFLDFLELAQQLLENLELEGILQIASFHPQYQFAGTSKDAAQNYTNRSPFPMIHLLREESVSWAVDNHPNVDDIPYRNIAHLQSLGEGAIKKLWNELTSTH